jgi:hypothetical protein
MKLKDAVVPAWAISAGSCARSPSKFRQLGPSISEWK